jgi:hypothetical protein
MKLTRVPETPTVYSDNIVALAEATKTRLLAHLGEAVRCGQSASGLYGLFRQELDRALGELATYDKCLLFSDTAHRNALRLADEVKALRSGCAVTYPFGDDPAENVKRDLDAVFAANPRTEERKRND